MSRFYSKKGTFFLKYFCIFSAIVLVSFFIIGVALMAFVTNFLRTENLDNTALYSKKIATTMTDLLNSPTAKNNPEGATLVVLKTLDIMSECSGNDVYICNNEGVVIACPETLSGFSLNSEDCQIHKDMKIPLSYIEKVKRHGISEFSTLGSVYESIHSIAIEPIFYNDTFVGAAITASPLSNTVVAYLTNIFKMFLFAAFIALVLVTIAVYILTGRIAKPIRNLETATRCYSAGDFSYRVPEIHSRDELSELIIKFNSMANSLEQLENSRRSFVANVSHEFKTPMTTIGGFINGILDGTIPEEKQSYYLEIVASEINRLSRMVTTMLNISKIETGNVELTVEQFDITEKLVTTFLGFEQLISKKNISVSGFDDLPKVLVHGDSAMLDQVVYNLVDNAVKFTNENGKILVNAASDKHYIYFSITNSGKGIPKKDISKVFERFYKVDQSRSTDVKSTGLGLFLIKSIIDLHGGTITAESEPDNFTRFTVKLPK